MGCLKQEKWAFEAAAKNAKNMPKLMGCCSNGICCCCPCHISKAKASNDEVQKAAKERYTKLYNE